MTNYQFHDVLVCRDCELWSRKKIDGCCRTPNKVYVFQYVNGSAAFIREQCLSCGGCLNMSKPLNFKEYSDKVDVRFSFSRDRLNEYKSEQRHEAELIYENERILKLQKSSYYKYVLHLQSDYWKRIRLKVLERDNDTCQECKEKPATEVHHLTYERLGKELLEDLLAVCGSCHLTIHETTVEGNKRP